MFVNLVHGTLLADPFFAHCSLFFIFGVHTSTSCKFGPLHTVHCSLCSVLGVPCFLCPALHNVRVIVFVLYSLVYCTNVRCALVEAFAKCLCACILICIFCYYCALAEVVDPLHNVQACSWSRALEQALIACATFSGKQVQ